MPKPRNNALPNSPWDSEIRLLAWLATCVSVISFLFYFQRGEVMLYGDAVAHMNIARRVFDSKTPGLLQLGTVWLPLPHLLMIPFLVSKEMWQRGAGGSIPSMAAYVFGVIGVFRLVRDMFPRQRQFDAPARLAPWLAAFVFAANPNLIYLQSTAMGESLYLAFFIWSVVFFFEALRDSRSLTKCGLCLAAACLTRYDGWFLAMVMGAVATIIGFVPSAEGTTHSWRFPKVAVLKFMLLIAAAPALWLTYNAAVYRNPLEFQNGPYSAKAIEKRTQNPDSPGHPGSGNLAVSGLYFLKSAQLNMADTQWMGRAWLLILLLGSLSIIWTTRSASSTATAASPPIWLPLAFLLTPVPFYALSVAYGGVPIFVPAWWPYTHYNIRYGLQVLPVFAVTFAGLVYLVLRSKYSQTKWQGGIFLLPLVFLLASYASVWRATPQTLQEAQINMRSRNHLEAELATWLKRLPSDSTLLMYLGDHVGAVQQAGIPLKHVINEGNHRVWKQPTDPDGLWEKALADPSRYADYEVAFEGDPVWQAVHNLGLRALVELHVTGQAPAILYRLR